jgi:hypothetical protein
MQGPHTMASLSRIQAGVLYALKLDATRQGSTYVTWRLLRPMAAHHLATATWQPDEDLLDAVL